MISLQIRVLWGSDEGVEWSVSRRESCQDGMMVFGVWRLGVEGLFCMSRERRGLALVRWKISVVWFGWTGFVSLLTTTLELVNTILMYNHFRCCRGIRYVMK
jgi:hypothetical protein